MHLDHAAAGAGWDDHIVIAFKLIQDPLSQAVGCLTVAAVVGRLTTAGLIWRHDHFAAGVLQQGHRRKPDLGSHQIHQTGHEQGDPATRF
jgi:hypothetical protein